MKRETKLTKEQGATRLLVDMRTEEVDAKLDAMSDEAVSADLDERGVSKDRRAAILAKQKQRFEKMRAEQRPARLEPAAPPPTRIRKRDIAFFGGGLGLAASFALAVAASTGAVATWFAPTHAIGSSPVGGLREEAFRARAGHRWQECLDKLDQAKAIDPHGDDDPDVRSARADAKAALIGAADGGK